MTNVYRYLVFALLIVISLSILGCASTAEQNNSRKQNNSYNRLFLGIEPYKDLATMKNDAGMIFLGTVTTVYPSEEQGMGFYGEDFTEPHYIPFTVSEIIVEDVIKGNINIGDSVKVRQVGGVIDGVVTYCEFVTLLSEGEKGIFFTDSMIIDKNSPPSILLLDQGIFRIEDGKIKPNEFQTELLKSYDIYDMIQQLKQMD